MSEAYDSFAADCFSPCGATCDSRGGIRMHTTHLPLCRYGAVLMVIVALFGITSPTIADSYPSKPVHLVVPWPPGGIADVRARLIGNRLGLALGQPVIVENRVGASATVGAQAVARAAPDGYTILNGSFI